MQEFNSHFHKKSMELLIKVACLNPTTLFSNCNKEKILLNFHLDNFNGSSINNLDFQLDTFVVNFFMKRGIQICLLFS